MAAKIFPSCYLPFFNIALLCFFIRCSLSAPVEPVYENFVRDMNASKCSSPDQIKLPLNASTSESNDNSLSAHLQLCQNLDTVQRRKEARYLCQEIFANLKVILCPPISAQVLAANLTLSKDVCKDIGSLKDSVLEDKVMLKRLTDIINCELMCDGEYETTCQILLWSHQLQQESKKIESSKKEAKENSVQGVLADAIVADDQNNGNQALQKNVTLEQQTVKTDIRKEQKSNELLTVQKSSTVKEDQQNQMPEQQGKPGSTLTNPSQIQQTEQSLNNPSLNHNDLAGNTSLDAGNKVSEAKEIQSNEIPGQDNEPPNAGLPEQDPHDQQEDPHDQQEVSHKEPDTDENQPQAPDNTLPNIKVKNELPNQPKGENPEQNKSSPQDNLPKIAVEEEAVDPHDAEEPGEETLEETEKKIPSDSDKQKTEVDKQTQGSEVVESKTTNAKTTIEKAVTTKHQSPEGTTKKLIIPTNKETTLKEQTSPSVKPQSTLDQKTLGLPSSVQPIESSSLAPSPKDLSVSTAALEEMEGDKAVHDKPEDREPDPYTDLENTEGDADDEYSRQDYGGVYEPKYKETFPIKPKEEEVPKMDVMRPREPSYNDFSPRNTYNRQPEVMPIFPDQEDGHFFFYFLSIVLILMGGYLLFHNKQKIIALIVEGRHERRRRSHGVGYKKLETK